MTNQNIMEHVIAATDQGLHAYEKIKVGINPKTISNIKINDMPKVWGTSTDESTRFWFELDGGIKDKSVVDHPCLYVLELSNPTEQLKYQLMEAYWKFRQENIYGQPNYRNISAAKKKTDFSSNTLYVGKVKRGINGRMFQHLGYGNFKTGALQLLHWTSEINLQINLHFYLLPLGTADYLEPLEYHLADKLNPLIGKHK